MSYDVEARLLGTDVRFGLSEPWTAYWIAFLRLVMGGFFLHAGLDKITNWPFDASWFVGGAAQSSILAPLITQFSSGVGLAIVNVAIPLGQLLIGLGLLVGALTRLAAFFGAVLMTFFYFVNGPNGGWAHGFINGDLMALFLFVTVLLFGAGRVWGVDANLERSDFVRNRPKLRYLLG